MRTIRVLIADDHPVVREGLVSLLSTAPDIEVLGTACDGEEAVGLAAELAPDVVLMDLSMPKLCGAEATRRIVARGCRTRVLVLTAYSDRARLRAALEHGAVGYLLKDSAASELVAGVRAAATRA